MESNNNINNSIIREQASDNKGFLFPISGDNEHIILYLIDLYEKVKNFLTCSIYFNFIVTKFVFREQSIEYRVC